MSYGVLDCDSYVTELHAYDFVIKEGLDPVYLGAPVLGFMSSSS